MGALTICQVIYKGDKYEFESPVFDKRISIIEGPNGSGKSTFFNLVYYGLGGKVDEFDITSKTKHPEITGDTNNFVWLNIRLKGVVFTLVRKIGENLITVRPLLSVDSEKSQEADTFPIYRKDGEIRTFSDWMLEKLGIPVVEIFQGGKSFKLNLSDLMRLVYHNQAPDPHGIYKPADNSNFLSDSLEIRRAIFQILVGKTLLALYEAVGNLKRSERELDAARAILLEYQRIVSEVLKERSGADVQNSHFLRTKIAEIDMQIDKLLRARSERVANRTAPSDLMLGINAERRRLGELNAHFRNLESRYDSAIRDKGRLLNVISAISEDIDRVSKVIFTHEQLKLFSSDTCPYCLNLVSRAEGHCVCGNKVDENDYQRFFYSASEYMDIYRAKRKSLDTMQSTIRAFDDDIAVMAVKREEFIQTISQLTDRVDRAYAAPDLELNDLQTDQLDEKLFDLRSEQNELIQALKMEQKIDGLQKIFESKKGIWKAADGLVRQLDLASKEELRVRVSEFDEIYDGFMTKVLAECRTARIDDDTYMPLINNGEYREASAEVSKRFLYYLTLLMISLKDDIPFPQLLLVDTPETAGIDRENLVLMLRQIKELDAVDVDYQILLSTGEGKFPPEFENYVAVRLRGDAKLLRIRGTPNV